MSIKIGIGRTQIFHGGGTPPFDWSSYWATLISATVENAAPTHVVLTFPTAQTSLTDTDFTIPGFTFASGSWTGAVLTLVLLYPVTYYSGNLTITCIPAAATATVTNNVAIANTVGWYVAGDGSATYVTKDANDLVSVWKDLSGAAHPLNQAAGTNEPKWESDGILFDGADNFLQAAPFAYNRPEKIYIVVKAVSWTDTDNIIDGNTNNSMRVFQSGATPGINVNMGAGASGLLNNDLTVGDFHILQILAPVNPGTVTTKIDNNAAVNHLVTANTDAGGLTIGKYGFAAAAYGHIKVKELIARNAVDDANTQTAIYNYLAHKYSFFLITT